MVAARSRRYATGGQAKEIRLKRRDDTIDVKEVILVDQLIGVEFSYFGSSDGDDQAEPRWLDRWQGAKLPLLVRMHINSLPVTGEGGRIFGCASDHRGPK